jgi:GT2 family glycosyltransferase
LAYLSEPVLRDAVMALLHSSGVDVDVVLVDNGCTTGDVDALADLPGVTVVRPGHNTGFSQGCNLGAAASTGEYVALINQDLVVEPGALARLVDELDKPGVGVAAGTVVLADDPTRLNSRGNPVHLLGISWVGGLGEVDTRTGPTEIAGAMGACLVTRRAHWDRLGGMFELYFANHEDADFSIRTWRLGLSVVSVPDAVARHRYEFTRNPQKFYLVERNRLIFLSTVWSGRALLALAPPLLGLEAAMLAVAIRDGWVRQKVRGWAFLVRHRGELRERRRRIQAERVVADREWMRVLTDQFDSPLVRVPGRVRGPLNAAMHTYWRAARRFV